MSPKHKGSCVNKAQLIYAAHSSTAEQHLFIVVDYSKYPEVEIIDSSVEKELLYAMERTFCTEGLTRTLKSHKGTPFKGKQLSHLQKIVYTTEDNATVTGGPIWPWEKIGDIFESKWSINNKSNCAVKSI